MHINVKGPIGLQSIVGPIHTTMGRMQIDGAIEWVTTTEAQGQVYKDKLTERQFCGYLSLRSQLRLDRSSSTQPTMVGINGFGEYWDRRLCKLVGEQWLT